MKVKKFQQGGPIGQDMQGQEQAQAQGGAPEQGQGQDQGGNPQEQVVQMAQSIIQQAGPDVAMALAQTILEMLQGGGGQPQQQPTFQRKGGVLVRKN